MGSDAHWLGEMTIGASGRPQLRVVPVLEGSCEKASDGFCSRLPNWKECKDLCFPMFGGHIALWESTGQSFGEVWEVSGMIPGGPEQVQG